MLLGKINTLIRYLYSAFVRKDEYSCYVLAEKISNLIYPKYKFSEFGRIYLDDQEFIDGYYQKFCGKNFHSLDRKYFLCELMGLVKDVTGDTAECGVFNGASSYLICEANAKSSREKVHFLFDSFAGLSQPQEKDGTYWQRGDLTIAEAIVKENLKEFPSSIFCKGWIPEAFPLAAARKFSFVHIDVDLYQPTFDSLAFFYDRMVPGGVILCDDYGFSTCPGATLAMDEFFSLRPESIVRVPTGQAFVVKQEID